MRIRLPDKMIGGYQLLYTRYWLEGICLNSETSEKIAAFSFIGNLMIYLHHSNLCNYYPEKITPVSALVMTVFSKFAIPAMSCFLFQDICFFGNSDLIR